MCVGARSVSSFVAGLEIIRKKLRADELLEDAETAALAYLDFPYGHHCLKQDIGLPADDGRLVCPRGLPMVVAA